MFTMIYSFIVAVIVMALSFEASTLILKILGFVLAAWIFIAGLIATYLPRIYRTDDASE